MNTFRKKFFNMLEEAPEDESVIDPGVMDEPTGDEALTGAVEPETDIASLGAPDNPEVALRKQQSQRTIATLDTWIGEISNFIEYLNGTDEGSINYSLNSADCDSLMTDVQRSESKKISRLAQDLSSLEESLKQYLLLARRKETNADSI